MTIPITKYEAAIIEAISEAHKADPAMDINVRLSRTAKNEEGKTEYMDIDARTIHGQLHLDIRDSPNNQGSGPRVSLTDVIDAQAGYYSGLKITTGTPAAVMEFTVEKEPEAPFIKVDAETSKEIQGAIAKGEITNVLTTDPSEKPKGRKHRNPDIGWKPEE